MIGYKGQTGPQKHFAENKEVSQEMARPVESLKEFRIGGFNQIVIPRFRAVGEEGAGRLAEVSHFARL